MTALDQNRAKSQLAIKAGQPLAAVKNVAIWGNHSATQYPDYFHATIGGKKATDVITDSNWLQTTFISTVQQRGAAVIAARGASRAAPAANAALDPVQGVVRATPAGHRFSPAGGREATDGVPERLVLDVPGNRLGGTVEQIRGEGAARGTSNDRHTRSVASRFGT